MASFWAPNPPKMAKILQNRHKNLKKSYNIVQNPKFQQILAPTPFIRDPSHMEHAIWPCTGSRPYSSGLAPLSRSYENHMFGLKLPRALNCRSIAPGRSG
jgi:hypothetical protein